MTDDRGPGPPSVEGTLNYCDFPAPTIISHLFPVFSTSRAFLRYALSQDRPMYIPFYLGLRCTSWLQSKLCK